jgi:hypothetical protein
VGADTGVGSSRELLLLLLLLLPFMLLVVLLVLGWATTVSSCFTDSLAVTRCVVAMTAAAEGALRSAGAAAMVDEALLEAESRGEYSA